MILPLDFYLRPVTRVAQELLGKTIITNIDSHYTESIIVETEAYEYPHDKGSHSYNNKRTPKNESMYLQGGHTYVYKCYGVHDMLNIVAEPEQIGTAVLIRAVEPINGIEIMQQRRKTNTINHILTGGPGKVCEALGINKEHDALLLIQENTTIQILDNAYQFKHHCNCPRVGMSHRVGDCANYPYRYYLNSKFVSRPLSVFYHY